MINNVLRMMLSLCMVYDLPKVIKKQVALFNFTFIIFSIWLLLYTPGVKLSNFLQSTVV